MLNIVAKLESTVTSMVEGKAVTKTGHFFVDQDAPTEVVKSMLFEFITYVGNLENAIKAQQAAVQVTETPAEAEPAAAAPSDKVVPLEQPQG